MADSTTTPQDAPDVIPQDVADAITLIERSGLAAIIGSAFRSPIHLGGNRRYIIVGNVIVINDAVVV